MSEKINQAYDQDTIQVLRGWSLSEKDRNVYRLHRRERLASWLRNCGQLH